MSASRNSSFSYADRVAAAAALISLSNALKSKTAYQHPGNESPAAPVSCRRVAAARQRGFVVKNRQKWSKESSRDRRVPVRLCLPFLEYEMQNLCSLQRLETHNITSKTLAGSQRRRRLEPQKDVALNPTMILPQEKTSPVHEGVRAIPQAALRRAPVMFFENHDATSKSIGILTSPQRCRRLTAGCPAPRAPPENMR